jgi:hypothetical protein
MAMTPTQRTLELLRSEGWLCTKIEYWNPWAKMRVDGFGWIDILAIQDGCIMGVQTTTSTNLAARLKKAKALAAFRHWLQAGGKAQFHGWKQSGNGRRLWQPRIVNVALEDLD